MCGSPMDLVEAKNGTEGADSSEILFILIDLYKSVLCVRFSLFPITNFSFYCVVVKVPP